MGVVNEFHEMGFNALLFQFLKEHGAHLVVDDALAFDGAAFFAVECGRIVLVFDHVERVVAGLEYFLCFAFVQLFQNFYCHDKIPPKNG